MLYFANFSRSCHNKSLFISCFLHFSYIKIFTNPNFRFFYSALRRTKRKIFFSFSFVTGAKNALKCEFSWQNDFSAFFIQAFLMAWYLQSFYNFKIVLSLTSIISIECVFLSPILMAFTGVTNAHGPLPQPTACRSPKCSLTTTTGSNQS